MKTLRLILCAIVAGLRQPFCTANAEGTAGTHEKAIGRFTDAAIATRHLLFKQGSDADHIVVCGANAIPLGTVADEATAAEARVHINLLGKGPTKRMVASEAISAGEQVYTAANGKVQDLPGAAGTYYLVGTALTAAAADGDVIEVSDCAPVATVVT